MALNAGLALHRGAHADAPLPGAAPQVLCGLAWFGVALAFSFLDRARDDLAFFATAWAATGLLGFGLGVRYRQRPGAGRTPTRVLTALACLLALFPGFLMFSLARWAAFSLLLVTAARGAAMHTRRDLYYALAAIIAVSLLVVSHDRAQWTVWFYLGPAWLCVALAFAWDYAAGVRLGASLKTGMTLAFFAACITLGGLLSVLLPLPRVPGFGFLDPPTDNPGHVGRPAGPDGGTRERGTPDPRRAGPLPQGEADGPGQGRAASRAGSGLGGGEREAPARGTGSASTPERTTLGDAVEGMRAALQDKGLPQWQRQIVEAMLAAAEAVARATGAGQAHPASRPMTLLEQEQARQRAAAIRQAIHQLLNLLWLALGLLLLWLLRWRVAGALSLTAATLLAPLSPGQSMRCSMLGLWCLLQRHGHARQPAQSLLEYVGSARFLQPALSLWLQQAVQLYGRWRFGGAPATREQARAVHRTVIVAEELMRKGKMA